MFRVERVFRCIDLPPPPFFFYDTSIFHVQFFISLSAPQTIRHCPFRRFEQCNDNTAKHVEISLSIFLIPRHPG